MTAPCVLVVESQEEDLRLIEGWLEDAGVDDVMFCPGPRTPAYTCIGSDGGPCPLSSAADVVEVTPELVGELLGAPRFLVEELEERTRVPGVAVGLAWTAAGGDILFIEATRMKGGKTLTLTGQLGDVMKESAQAALSWVRSHASDLGIRSDFWDTSDIHVHVPAGAIPKDGPSAGVTMVTALASLMTQRAVKPRLAMTGEVTLSGRVLAVGGIKEKAGISTVILPRRNEKNLLEDVPKRLRETMTFHLVDSVEEVLDLALDDALPRGGRIRDALLSSRN